MIRQIKKSIKISFGILIILFGIIGVLLPIVPGTIIFVMGLAVLSTEFLWAKRLYEIIKMKSSLQKKKYSI